MLRQDAELNPDAYNHAQVRIVYSLQTPCRNLLLQMYSMLLSTIHASTVNGTATMARHAVYVVGAHSDVDGDLVVIGRPPPSRSSSIVRAGGGSHPSSLVCTLCVSFVEPNGHYRLEQAHTLQDPGSWFFLRRCSNDLMKKLSIARSCCQRPTTVLFDSVYTDHPRSQSNLGRPSIQHGIVTHSHMATRSYGVRLEAPGGRGWILDTDRM